MVDKITNPPSQKDLIDKVNELVDNKQDTLVSGTNIKTINNTSILGSGNIDIQGGGSSYTAGDGIDITNAVISVTSDISTGAALGATAVQPADLASVATSGSYNDLSNKPDLNSKADIDLSNITSTGKNITNWSNNVTNCITEIPQDIKLELNNGTVTLKAGSKVYVPNGAGVFDVVNISSDITLTQQWGGSEDCLLFVYGGNSVNIMPINRCSSGASDSISGSDHFYYNTANNTLRFIESSGNIRNTPISLPVAIVKMSGNGATVSSIDQVFNGFGYIGKRNFITNVKLRIAKGYNTDGTYHNQEYIINSPIISLNDFGNNSIMFFRNNNGSYQIYNIGEQNYLGELDYVPNVGGGFQWYYNTTNRMWYMHEAGEQSWRQIDYANIGINTSTETNFKEVFRAADCNDVVLKQDFQVVSTLPANPDANTFYFIPE